MCDLGKMDMNSKKKDGINHSEVMLLFFSFSFFVVLYINRVLMQRMVGLWKVGPLSFVWVVDFIRRKEVLQGRWTREVNLGSWKETATSQS